MEVARQYVCNAYANQCYNLSEPNLQFFTVTVQGQLGILSSNLNVVGVHAYHINYTTMRMSA